MTDREALLALLERFKLQPTSEGKWPTNETAVTLAVGEGGVEGYGGFLTVFHFEQSGAFRSVSLWE